MRNTVVLLVLYIFAMFQMQLLHMIQFLSYVDELVVLWALYYLIKNINGCRRYLYILLLIIAISIYGIGCNISAKIQTSWIPIFTDVGNCFKVFVAYMGASLYFRQNYSKSCFRVFIEKASYFNYAFISLILLFYFLNLFLDLDMSPDVRFGMKSYAFIYGGASKFSYIFFLILPVLTINYSIKKTRISQLFLFIALALWLTSLRSKVLVFVALYLILYIYTFVKKKKFKFNLYNVGLGLLITFLILEDQFHVYMDGESSARYFLLMNGIRTMHDYFPCGAGFGTFATDVASTYYSPLYYRYGMQYVYGLSPDDPKFSHDSYWPAIMGQFGFIGLVAFCILIYLFLKDIVTLSKSNKTLKMVCVFFCVTQLISSLASPVFFSFMTVWEVFFIALYINSGNELSIKAKIRKFVLIRRMRNLLYNSPKYQLNENINNKEYCKDC